MKKPTGVSDKLWLLVILALLAGCDSNPGVFSPEGFPPVVADLEFTPDSVLFDGLPPEQVQGDTLALVRLQISARVTDGDNDVDSVAWFVDSPFDPFAPLASGRMQRSAADRFSAETTLRLPRGNEGNYSVVVFAVDTEGQLSNQGRGLFNFRIGTGRAPTIERIEGPNQIRPPTTLTLIAVVDDPDGLGNISSVVVRTPNGSEFNMVDDGQTFGDERAGDGRYTARFDVPQADPGTFTFEFQAFDRSGLASEIVIKEITVL